MNHRLFILLILSASTLPSHSDIQPLLTLKAPDSGHIGWFAFSADGKRLVADLERSVAVWEIPSGNRVFLASNEENGAYDQVAISNDGKWIATAEKNKTVFLRDGQSGMIVKQWQIPNEQDPSSSAGVKSIGLSPNRTTLLVSTYSPNMTYLWNWEINQTNAIPDAKPYKIQVFPGEEKALLQTDNRTLILSLEEGRILYEYEGTIGSALTTEGRLIHILKPNQLVSSETFTVLTVSADSGEIIKKSDEFPNLLNMSGTLQISPEGHYIAFAAGDPSNKSYRINLFDWKDQKKLEDLILPESKGISILLFSPNGRDLGANDGTALSIFDMSHLLSKVEDAGLHIEELKKEKREVGIQGIYPQKRHR